MAAIIYRNIKRLASERNISIRKIERDCELGNGTIGQIEHGNPTISTLTKIAYVLECTVDDLLKEGD